MIKNVSKIIQIKFEFSHKFKKNTPFQNLPREVVKQSSKIASS